MTVGRQYRAHRQAGDATGGGWRGLVGVYSMLSDRKVVA